MGWDITAVFKDKVTARFIRKMEEPQGT